MINLIKYDKQLRQHHEPKKVQCIIQKKKKVIRILQVDKKATKCVLRNKCACNNLEQ
jgi:hypothetical protein